MNLKEPPTTTQLVGPVQDTLSGLSDAFSLAVESIDQFVPSQDSTSACPGPKNGTSWPLSTMYSIWTDSPTAMQKVALVHDTLWSMLFWFGGVDVDSTDQVDPFQDSARVWAGKLGVSSPTAPTATQEMGLEVTHDTLVKLTAPLRFGVETRDQFVPLQVSARPSGTAAELT